MIMQREGFLDGLRAFLRYEQEAIRCRRLGLPPPVSGGAATAWVRWRLGRSDVLLRFIARLETTIDAMEHRQLVMQNNIDELRREASQVPVLKAEIKLLQRKLEAKRA